MTTITEAVPALTATDLRRLDAHLTEHYTRVNLCRFRVVDGERACLVRSALLDAVARAAAGVTLADPKTHERYVLAMRAHAAHSCEVVVE